jgi:hypothetical protein
MNGEDVMTLITNGVSQTLSTGYSWGTYCLGEGSTLGSLVDVGSTGAAIGASLWGVVSAVKKVKEGWDTGDKTKMAAGTVQCLLAATEVVPDDWKTAMADYLGGFSDLLPAIPAAMLFYEKYEKEIGYLVAGAPVAFAAGLKKLVGDEATWDDDGIAGLFAFLTAVANAYEADPAHWLSNLNAALPTFEKIIPCWALIRDREDIMEFVKANAASVSGYVANVSNFALRNAGISVASPCGNQMKITGQKKGKSRKAKRKGGRRK